MGQARPLPPGRKREAGNGIVSLVPRPGGYGIVLEAMLEVATYVSSALLTPCSALVQLGSCEAQHCSVFNAMLKSEWATAVCH